MVLIKEKTCNFVVTAVFFWRYPVYIYQEIIYYNTIYTNYSSLHEIT